MVWLWYYRDSPAEHKSVNAGGAATRIDAALGHRTGTRPGRFPGEEILSSRKMWTLAAMYVCYSVILIIFLTWFPKYLISARGADLKLAG